MKLIKPAAVLFFILLGLNINAQNLIGYTAKDIRSYMMANRKDMSYDNMVYNNTFKYLRYIDRNENQTLMFFLTTDSVCKSIRLVCDMNLKPAKVKELDSMYKKSGENKWTDDKNGKKYLIELREEEWSFSITISPNE
jgi:hypothetical protein